MSMCRRSDSTQLFAVSIDIPWLFWVSLSQQIEFAWGSGLPSLVNRFMNGFDMGKINVFSIHTPKYSQSGTVQAHTCMAPPYLITFRVWDLQTNSSLVAKYFAIVSNMRRPYAITWRHKNTHGPEISRQHPAMNAA